MNRCRDIRERVISIGLGETDEVAQSHIATCEPCRLLSEQIAAIAQSLRTEVVEPPERSIERAKAIRLPEPKIIRLGVESSTFATAQRRSEEDSFQYVYGSGGQRARMMYRRTNDGWEILGETNFATSATAFLRTGESIEIDANGRFSFHAPDLEATEVHISLPDGEFIIPAAANDGTEPTA